MAPQADLVTRATTFLVVVLVVWLRLCDVIFIVEVLFSRSTERGTKPERVLVKLITFAKWARY